MLSAHHVCDPHEAVVPLHESDVLWEAARLNQPCLCFEGREGGDFTFPWRLEGGPVVLETVKRSERGEGTVFRFYEPFGRRVTVRFHLSSASSRLRETDLLENPVENLKKTAYQQQASAGDWFILDFAPFEIKTLMAEG